MGPDVGWEQAASDKAPRTRAIMVIDLRITPPLNVLRKRSHPQATVSMRNPGAAER